MFKIFICFFSYALNKHLLNLIGVLNIFPLMFRWFFSRTVKSCNSIFSPAWSLKIYIFNIIFFYALEIQRKKRIFTKAFRSSRKYDLLLNSMKSLASHIFLFCVCSDLYNLASMKQNMLKEWKGYSDHLKDTSDDKSFINIWC